MIIAPELRSERLFWLATLLLAVIVVTLLSVGESRRAALINRSEKIAQQQSELVRQRARELRLQHQRLRNAEELQQKREHYRKGDFWRREELERWDEFRELLLNAA